MVLQYRNQMENQFLYETFHNGSTWDKGKGRYICHSFLLVVTVSDGQDGRTDGLNYYSDQDNLKQTFYECDTSANERRVLEKKVDLLDPDTIVGEMYEIEVSWNWVSHFVECILLKKKLDSDRLDET